MRRDSPDVFEPMVSDARRERLVSVSESRLDSVTVVMDAPHDPHNGAAVIRSCDAFGVQCVHVIPRDEEFLVSSVVTKGSERWVDVIHHTSPGAAISALKDAGYALVGSHPQGQLVPGDLMRLPRVAIVLGNEHDGIRPELERALDHTVRIPMCGFVESLNLSVSAAILLVHAVRERPGDLEPGARRQLYARWLMQTVPRSREILDALPPR